MRACWVDAWRNDVMSSGNVWHVTDKARLCRVCSRRVRVSRAVVMWLGVAVSAVAVWLMLVAVAV